MTTATTVVGLVGAGAMGSAVGAAYAAGGARAVTTLVGRSERTARLVRAAWLDVLPDLDAVVRSADVVVSIVPPDQAVDAAAAIAAAAQTTGSRPLVADLNAIAPVTALAIERALADAGLELVDGSISGGPPRAGGSTRVYLSGTRAAELAALPAPGVDARVVGPAVGTASAVKMCTASIYKGTTALLAHALLTAHANGVLPHVLDDLGEGFPALVERAAVSVASATAKAHRFAGEMREIAATQAAAGLAPELFDGLEVVYSALARTGPADEAPEDVRDDVPLEELLERIRAGYGGV